MSSQSADINRNKTVALTNTSKCKWFIFDVTLDLSYDAGEEWEVGINLWWLILTTITGRIGHKYRNWKKCSFVIAYSLLDKSYVLEPSLKEWKGTISVSGLYYDYDPVNGYSEMIHDWFCYEGFMTIPENYTSRYQLQRYPFSLKYTIKFLLSPALPSAQSIYYDRGYKEIRIILNTWRMYKAIMDAKVDHEKEYNHLEVWLEAHNPDIWHIKST